MKTFLKLCQVTSYAALCFVAPAAFAFGNEDVIKLLSAKFSEETILQAISTASAPTFDTSVDGLIALKQAGATDAVVQKILSFRANQSANTAGTPAPVTDEIGNCPADMGGPLLSNLGVRVGGQAIRLPYEKDTFKQSVDGTSAFVGALSFGLVDATVHYTYTLPGEKSSVHITEKTPEIIGMIISWDASPDDGLILLRMTPGDGMRTGGWLLKTNGERGTFVFPEGSRIRLQTGKAIKRCMWGGKAYALYNVKPAVPLEKGEYGFVAGNGVFDFGVD